MKGYFYVSQPFFDREKFLLWILKVVFVSCFIVWKSEIMDKESEESLEKSRKKNLNLTVKHSNLNEWTNLPQLWVSYSQTFTELVKHKKSISSMKANRDPFVSSSGCLVKFESSFAHLQCFGYFVMISVKKLLLQNI